MSRSIGGNYTLAAGNPVQTNTVISTTWANSTLNDIANALTDSLSRTGLGGMTNPLKLPDGISRAPALTFSAEATTGLYRADDGILGLSVLGTVFLTAGDSELLSPQALRGQKGLTITNSTTNGAGTTSTGNGTAAGGVFTGGSSAGNGLTVTGGASSGTGLVATGGSTNGVGASISGTGTGTGLNVTGGTTGWGINTTGTIGLVATGTNDVGMTGIGSAGNAGLKAIAGTDASATTAQTAIFCEKGYLTFTGASAGAAVNPNSNVAFTNTLTPKNVCKAWASVVSTGSSSVSVSDGFNITSVGLNGTDMDVVIAGDMASVNYTVVITTTYVDGGGLPDLLFATLNKATTGFTVRMRSIASAAIKPVFSTACVLDITVFGAQ